MWEASQMRKKIWRGRGRFPSGMHSYADRKALEYLARIAVMHKIDSSEFFNCIVEAWNQEESECKQLIIKCRKRAKDSVIFLFTSGEKVVAQFPIPTTILQGNNQLEGYMKMIAARPSSVKNFEVINPRIKDLKPGMKKVTLKARVIEIPKPKMVYTRFGTEAHVSNALIADETGTMRMSLWNQQISMVSKGDVIKIENGKVASFKGERQLRVGRHGRISVANHDSTASNIKMTN